MKTESHFEVKPFANVAVGEFFFHPLSGPQAPAMRIKNHDNKKNS